MVKTISVYASSSAGSAIGTNGQKLSVCVFASLTVC